jgi:hypothetical protein
MKIEEMARLERHTAYGKYMVSIMEYEEGNED